MISFRHKGDFSKTFRFLERAKAAARLSVLDRYGRMGVAALESATPVDSGLTARSWSYEVVMDRNSARLEFHNSHINDGVNVAILLQYGHGTGTGGWIEGIDYINPAVQPIFEQIVEDVWKEVTSL